MKKKFKVSYELIMVIILIVMVAAFGVIVGGKFANPVKLVTTMVNATTDVSYLGVMGMSMTLIILTSGIDLAVFYQMICAGMVCAWVYGKVAPGSVALAVILALVSCLVSGAFFGAVNGFIADKTPINPWLITMSTMYILQAISWFFGTSFSFSNDNPIVGVMNYKIAGFIPTQLILLLIVYIIFYILEKKTTFGRYVHAVGFNENAVNYSGIDAGKIKFWVYTLGGLLSGVGAIMYLGKGLQLNQETGTNMNIEVIALVVLGGTSTAGGVGGVTGTLLACLILGVLKKGLALKSLPGTYYNFIVGIVLIGSLILFAYLEKKKKLVSRKMAIENMAEQQ